MNNETWKHLLEKSVKWKNENVNHGRRPDNWLYIKPGIPLVKFISNFNTICKYGALTSSYKAIHQPRMYIQHDNTLQNILGQSNYCYRENLLWIWFSFLNCKICNNQDVDLSVKSCWICASSTILLLVMDLPCGVQPMNRLINALDAKEKYITITVISLWSI